MPAWRTSGTLFLQLTEMRIERDRLRRENELLREQLRRHSSGELQIREVRRELSARLPALASTPRDRESPPA